MTTLLTMKGSDAGLGVNSYPRLTLFIRALVLIFPMLIATFGAGSYVFFLLVLPALYFGRGWSSLHVWERRLLWGYAIAFIVIALSLVNAEDLREGVKALDRYLRLTLLIPLYLMFRRMGFSFGRELALGAVAAGFLMLAQGLYQVEVLGRPFAYGHYHKIVFGDLAMLWAAIATLFALFALRHPLARMGVALSVVAAMYASLLSQTRGAWLFVPVFIIVLLGMQWGRLRAGRSWMIFGVLVLLAAGVGLATQSERLQRGVAQGMQDLQSFAEDPAVGSSWGIRLNLWRNSLLLLQETPLLGTGVGDFQGDMQRLVDEGVSWNSHVIRYGHAHSIYFDTLAKGGILGFLATVTAYLLLPLFAFLRGWRSAAGAESRLYALGGVVLVAAFATFGFSEGLWARNPFVNTYVVCMVVMLAGMVNSGERGDARLDKRI